MKRHRLLVAVFASMALAGWAGDTEIIVESYTDGLNSAAFSKVEGKWNDSTAKSTAEGLQATKSVYNDANSDPGTARFTPQIPVAGKYEIFITYPTSGNASDIKYTVVSAEGSKELTLTQNGRQDGHTPGANKWSSLGTFTFNEGNSGYVELSDPLTGAKPLDNEPNARIYADAVKFVPVGMSLPDDYVNAGKSGAAPAAAAPTPAPTTVAAAATPTPAAGAALPGLPSLPGAPQASPTPAAGLPALPDAAASPGGLPSLPPATASASQALPGLPSTTPPAAGMPALPETPAAPQAGLPGLPELPAGQGSVSTATESSVVTAQATPMATPNLPSLAPVTPTPQPNMPSPADTPAAGVPGSLPGGALSAITPAPFASAPGAPSMPATLPPPATTTAAAGRSDSITQNNPANLQWMYDYGAALNVARARGKKVMVFFTAPGNTVADTYETQYFMHPAVRQALNNYVLVKVDFPKNTRLGYSLGIFGAGIVVVTDATGDVLVRVEQIPATPQDLIKLMAGAQPAAVATPAAAAAVPGAGSPAAATTATVTEVEGAIPPMPGAATPAVAEVEGAIPPMPGAPTPAVTEVEGAIPPMPGATPSAPGAPPMPGAPAAPGVPPGPTPTPVM